MIYNCCINLTLTLYSIVNNSHGHWKGFLLTRAKGTFTTTFEHKKSEIVQGNVIRTQHHIKCLSHVHNQRPLSAINYLYYTHASVIGLWRSWRLLGLRRKWKANSKSCNPWVLAAASRRTVIPSGARLVWGPQHQLRRSRTSGTVQGTQLNKINYK